MEYNYSICSDSDCKYICDKLVEYNLSKVPATQEKEFEDINIKLTDSNGDTVGGCISRMYCWNVLYIDILWLDESIRGKGYGTRLLKHIENIAAAKGCYLIHLDTFDFQAKDFYIKNGYELFGTLEDCPRDHCRYYLQKRLNTAQYQ